MLPGSGGGRHVFRISGSSAAQAGFLSGILRWFVDLITGDRETDSDYREYQAPEVKAQTLVLPILLLAAAVFVEVLTRSIALYEQRDRLERMLEAQQSRYDTALRLQRQLEGIAAGTARLARGGNANAIQVINRLRAVGVTVNPDALKAESDSPQ